MPRKKTVAMTVVKRGPGRPPGPRTVAAGGAAAAVATLRRYHSELCAQQQSIAAQVQAVEAAIRAVSGVGGASMPRASFAAPRRMAGGSGRRPRSGSLKEYILKVLHTGGTMSVKDITEAVRKAGYPTKNQTLAKSVGIALTATPGVAKVARGKFRLA